MGAGSTVFVKNVLGDTLLTDALNDCEIALYDIDAHRLEESYLVVKALNKKYNADKATIKKYLGVSERKAALKGARFVINAIQVGLYDPCTIIDFEVPKKYGLRQTIGDTLGIGGIFRGLRTIHVLKDFAADMQEVAAQLHQPHGHTVGLYATVHKRKDGGFVPQRASLLARFVKGTGNGGCTDRQRAYSRHKPYGMAVGNPR